MFVWLWKGEDVGATFSHLLVCNLTSVLFLIALRSTPLILFSSSPPTPFASLQPRNFLLPLLYLRSYLL